MKNKLTRRGDKVKTAEIKKKISFSKLFKELYPDYYRDNGNASCPFHDDRTPSLQLEQDHGYCHAGCAPKGESEAWDIFSLYQEKYDCDFKTAWKELSLMAGLDGGKKGKKQKGKICRYHPSHKLLSAPSLLYSFISIFRFFAYSI